MIIANTFRILNIKGNDLEAKGIKCETDHNQTEAEKVKPIIITVDFMKWKMSQD